MSATMTKTPANNISAASISCTKYICNATKAANPAHIHFRAFFSLTISPTLT